MKKEGKIIVSAVVTAVIFGALTLLESTMYNRGSETKQEEKTEFIHANAVASHVQKLDQGGMYLSYKVAAYWDLVFSEKFEESPELWIDQMLRISNEGKEDVSLYFEEEGIEHRLTLEFERHEDEVYYSVYEEKQISTGEICFNQSQKSIVTPVVLRAQYPQKTI